MAKIEVKGVRSPVQWACLQKLNEDGSLTLRPDLREAILDEQHRYRARQARILQLPGFPVRAQPLPLEQGPTIMPRWIRAC